MIQRMSTTDAGRCFDELVGRVFNEGITVELEKDNRVIARLSPAGRTVRVSDLNQLFASLPKLGDDADSFARDVERARQEVPAESDPWG
jgi:antitoxin (DNA-binding transcriptional repressor) of toxin-antitoxin stability system